MQIPKIKISTHTNTNPVADIIPKKFSSNELMASQQLWCGGEKQQREGGLEQRRGSADGTQCKAFCLQPHFHKAEY